MIKVNLLPPEYRKVERTPVLRFVTIVCGVILSASAIGAFLFVHFGSLVEMQLERQQLEEAYHHHLQWGMVWLKFLILISQRVNCQMLFRFLISEARNRLSFHQITKYYMLFPLAF